MLHEFDVASRKSARLAYLLLYLPITKESNADLKNSDDKKAEVWRVVKENNSLPDKYAVIHTQGGQASCATNLSPAMLDDIQEASHALNMSLSRRFKVK